MNLPVRLSGRQVDCQDSRKDWLPVLHGGAVTQSPADSLTGLRPPRSGRSSGYRVNSLPLDSSEPPAPRIIDLGFTRSASVYRLDYLQEQKFDAYRRSLELRAAARNTTYPSVDIYV